MPVFNVLLYAFATIIGIQFVYYVFVFSRFAFAKTENPSLKNIPVSVIVCAKNEADNLTLLIPKLLEQTYKQFEIVLINDGSIDNSLEIMESYKANHTNIKVVNVIRNEAFWGNKKYALTLGIKAATHDYLLFTDADCIPKTNQWIQAISSHFTNEKSIVIGYGAYAKQKPDFLNKLIRFETLLTAMQYMSYAKIGMPYMAVGRNLAYKKNTFFKANGFMNHIKIRSGDDDLFVNQAATNTNISCCFSEKSFTISNPETSFKKWLNQKRRHISTAKHYKFKHKFMLGLFYVSQFLFWLLAMVLLVAAFKPIIVVALIIFRFLYQFIIVGYAAKELNETDTIFMLPLLELFLIVSQLYIFMTNLISKPTLWK
jgi:glycosyltransferase involved in cell wall biosynthesis